MPDDLHIRVSVLVSAPLIMISEIAVISTPVAPRSRRGGLKTRKRPSSWWRRSPRNAMRTVGNALALDRLRRMLDNLDAGWLGG
jgi:hypothetical protein